MNASKTVALPVGALFARLVDDERREAWLGADVLRLRASVPPKSARFDAVDEDGDGIHAAAFVDKGAKSAVQLQLNDPPDETTLAARKALWTSSLAALAKQVG